MSSSAARSVSIIARSCVTALATPLAASLCRLLVPMWMTATSGS